jgi:hypothetical protein
MDNASLGTAAMLAVFLMPLVSLIKKPSWSPKTTYLLGMAAAIVCAVVGAVVDGDVKSPQEFVAYFGVALATSQSLYTLYFRDTELQSTLAGIGA